MLLCLTHEHGYGNWNAIKHAIRRDTRCRYDHLFMSRSAPELQKRVDILVKALEKERELEGKNNSGKQDKLAAELEGFEFLDIDPMDEEDEEDKEDQEMSEPDKKQNDEYAYLKDEEEARVGGEGGMPEIFEDEIGLP